MNEFDHNLRIGRLIEMFFGWRIIDKIILLILIGIEDILRISDFSHSIADSKTFMNIISFCKQLRRMRILTDSIIKYCQTISIFFPTKIINNHNIIFNILMFWISNKKQSHLKRNFFIIFGYMLNDLGIILCILFRITLFYLLK